MSTLMKHVQERRGDFPVSFRAARFSTAQQSVPTVQASTLVKEDSWDSGRERKTNLFPYSCSASQLTQSGTFSEDSTNESAQSASGGELKFASICLLTTLCALPQIIAAQLGSSSVPDANPGRPTVSTPATLTPVGYLQFENGGVFAEESPEFSNRVGTSQVTKLSVVPRLEFFLQSEPLAISTSEGQTSVHEGEVFAGFQTAVLSGRESGHRHFSTIRLRPF